MNTLVFVARGEKNAPEIAGSVFGDGRHLGKYRLIEKYTGIGRHDGVADEGIIVNSFTNRNGAFWKQGIADTCPEGGFIFPFVFVAHGL